MKNVLVLTVLLLLAGPATAETATDGNITIGIEVPEYVSQNEIFDINLSAVNESVYPVARGYLYLDALLLKKSWIFFFESNEWDETVSIVFIGGTGGIEWSLPSDADLKQGQTIPLKFRAQKVTHTFYFRGVYWPYGCSHSCILNMPPLIVSEDVTVEPVYDPSVHVTVYNENSVVFEADPGKGVDYIRFSNGNDQYIVNWDTSGSPPGEYSIKVSFDNGYEKITTVSLS